MKALKWNGFITFCDVSQSCNKRTEHIHRIQLDYYNLKRNRELKNGAILVCFVFKCYPEGEKPEQKCSGGLEMSLQTKK